MNFKPTPGDTLSTYINGRKNIFTFNMRYIIYNPENFRPMIFVLLLTNKKIEKDIDFFALSNSKTCRCLLLEKKALIYKYEI